jgi:two-component system, NarL family, sensor histidine kinase DesK
MGLLHTTRQELARVKVEEERQRFSRDLHDVLGHSLATITLKSELARLLIEEDPARCTQELSEIEGVARTSLRDVREAVAGYRQPSFESELAGARQLLEAAGIDVRWQVQADLLNVLSPEADVVLAWTVREGATNIIRHSRAHHCTLALTQQGEDIRLEVLNDQGPEEPPNNAARRPGIGLVGLRERVREQGGQMEAGPFLVAGKAHFRLQVALPLPSARWATSIKEECS